MITTSIFNTAIDVSVAIATFDRISDVNISAVTLVALTIDVSVNLRERISGVPVEGYEQTHQRDDDP